MNQGWLAPGAVFFPSKKVFPCDGFVGYFSFPLVQSASKLEAWATHLGKLMFLHFQTGAKPLMDRKVVGVVFYGMAAMVAVATPPQLLDVVWFSVVVVVVVV